MGFNHTTIYSLDFMELSAQLILHDIKIILLQNRQQMHTFRSFANFVKKFPMTCAEFRSWLLKYLMSQLILFATYQSQACEHYRSSWSIIYRLGFSKLVLAEITLPDGISKTILFPFFTSQPRYCFVFLCSLYRYCLKFFCVSSVLDSHYYWLVACWQCSIRSLATTGGTGMVNSRN